MGARQKLNAAYLNGCLLVAAAAGLVTGSWSAAIAAAIVMTALAVYDRGIRPGPKPPEPARPSLRGDDRRPRPRRRRGRASAFS